MTANDQEQFSPVTVALKDNRSGVIRPLRPDDAEALGEFYESVPHEDKRFYCPYPLTRERARQNAADAFNPYRVVLVLEAGDGSIGGYAWYQWEEGSDRCHFGICIRREFQGSGAGKALVRRLLEISRVVGPPIMCLTVQKANPRAVRLYCQVGFQVVREQVRGPIAEEGWPSEPEYYMELNTPAVRGS